MKLINKLYFFLLFFVALSFDSHGVLLYKVTSFDGNKIPFATVKIGQHHVSVYYTNVDRAFSGFNVDHAIYEVAGFPYVINMMHSLSTHFKVPFVILKAEIPWGEAGMTLSLIRPEYDTVNEHTTIQLPSNYIEEKLSVEELPELRLVSPAEVYKTYCPDSGASNVEKQLMDMWLYILKALVDFSISQGISSPLWNVSDYRILPKGVFLSGKVQINSGSWCMLYSQGGRHVEFSSNVAAMAMECITQKDYEGVKGAILMSMGVTSYLCGSLKFSDPFYIYRPDSSSRYYVGCLQDITKLSDNAYKTMLIPLLLESGIETLSEGVTKERITERMKHLFKQRALYCKDGLSLWDFSDCFEEGFDDEDFSQFHCSKGLVIDEKMRKEISRNPVPMSVFKSIK
ncbi:hypothetical protein ACWJJH_16955 [Endozoicomonadaceae bacterium StTr2]